MEINLTNRLELHYYLKDNKHSLDAFLRNECEKELLAIVRILSTELDIDVSVFSEVPKEGGFKDIWKFIGKNSIQITLLINALTFIYSRSPVENSEIVELQKENLELDNQIKKAELIKLSESINSDSNAKEIAKTVVEYLKYDPKISWHKSNFYKKLITENDIEEISFVGLDETDKETTSQQTVERKDFSSFIFVSNEFPPIIDEEAVIEIISPVLKPRNFHWRGNYKGEEITFQMKDEDFKNSVKLKSIQFTNGIAIKCVLQQNRRIDSNGNIFISFNKVLTVLEVFESNLQYETEQGKRYKKAKANISNQLKLDL